MAESKIYQISSSMQPGISTKSVQSDETNRIVFRWKRSVYKLLWKHMLIYVLIYSLLSLTYQFILNEKGKKHFKELAEYCSSYSRSISLMVLLGFFTSTALHRLFIMQRTLPGTAKSITVFMSSLKSDLPEGPFIIEQFARWQVLVWVLAFRLVSKPLHKSLPDLISLQAAGLLTEEEKIALERKEILNNNTPAPLIVIDWLLLLLKETQTNGRFFCEFNYLRNVDLLMSFKKSCSNALKFSKQNGGMPPQLVQTVVLVVYYFGLITLMGRCFSDESNDSKSIAETWTSYIPLLPGMQFFIYFSFLCFGKAAVDPFGDDDDDIDVESLLLLHVEGSLRLKEIYNTCLEDVFPNIPHKIYNNSSA